MSSPHLTLDGDTEVKPSFWTQNPPPSSSGGLYQITATSGVITLPAGTLAAATTVPLTGPLTLIMPSGVAYPHGKRLLISTQPGHTSFNHALSVIAADNGDTINGQGSSSGGIVLFNVSGLQSATLVSEGDGDWLIEPAFDTPAARDAAIAAASIKPYPGLTGLLLKSLTTIDGSSVATLTALTNQGTATMLLSGGVAGVAGQVFEVNPLSPTAGFSAALDGTEFTSEYGPTIYMAGLNNYGFGGGLTVTNFVSAVQLNLSQNPDNSNAGYVGETVISGMTMLNTVGAINITADAATLTSLIQAVSSNAGDNAITGGYLNITQNGIPPAEANDAMNALIDLGWTIYND